MLPFPTELFIVNTVVCDEVHTGMKYTSSKAKLCSWVYYESIDFCSFHSVLPLSDYQENSFNHDHLRNFSLRVICQAVISRFLLDAFNRSKDSSKSRHLQGDSYSSSASFCSHHHHLASFFILSLLYEQFTCLAEPGLICGKIEIDARRIACGVDINLCR